MKPQGDIMLEMQKNLDVNVKNVTKEKRKMYFREYYLKNKERLNSYNSKWKTNKYKNNINFKLLSNLRRRMLKSLKNVKKNNKTIDLIGCSVHFLKKYIESKFKPGMTWENRHEWHIDHIKPCASFDFTDPKQQAECFHYTNLQPLWAQENIIKGSKW